ncbi:MAG: hypothetical protein LQ352_007010, partial [Teloschistes flavicans]
ADENVLLMEMITGERPNMNYLAATLNRSKSAIAAHSKILKEKADKAYIARQSKAEPSTAPVDPDEVIEAIKIFQPKPRAPRKPKDETAAKKKAGEGEAKAVAKRGRELNSDSGVPLTKRARGTGPKMATAAKIDPEEPYDPASVLQLAKATYEQMVDTPLTAKQMAEAKRARTKQAKKNK